MPTLVFDIETAGEDFENFDETTQHVLTRWIESESKNKKEYEAALEKLKDGLGFSPLTGYIVAIGIRDVERKKGAVYFQASPGKVNDTQNFEEDDVKFEVMTEGAMLQKFWEVAEKYQVFVTFNGRGFDVPFLMARSMILGVKPTKNLMSNRYLSYQPWDAKHVDLLDQLSFYGAMQRKGSLHLWCHALGIESPKAQGVEGDDVKALFESGRAEDVARYNARDLVATAELYQRYQDFLAF
jgi:DNA polymerase elongation subunit (family B)